MMETAPDHNLRLYNLGRLAALLIVILSLIAVFAQTQLAGKSKEDFLPFSTSLATSLPVVPNREQWSLEIVSAPDDKLAKERAVLMQQKGYRIQSIKSIKKPKPALNQLLVSEEKIKKVQILLADLVDLGISTYSGILRDSTASARIVIIAP